MFEYIDEIPLEHDQLHSHVLAELVGLFSNGQISTFLQSDPFGAEVPVPPNEWYGPIIVTHPRFVFGETQMDKESRQTYDEADEADERGDGLIYIDEVQLEACLSIIKPLPSPKEDDFSQLSAAMIDEWIEHRLVELNNGPPSVCAKKTVAVKIIREELSLKKRYVTDENINQCWRRAADAGKFTRLRRNPGVRTVSSTNRD